MTSESLPPVRIDAEGDAYVRAEAGGGHDVYLSPLDTPETLRKWGRGHERAAEALAQHLEAKKAKVAVANLEAIDHALIGDWTDKAWYASALARAGYRIVKDES